jgi:hypothetical protein
MIHELENNDVHYMLCMNWNKKIPLFFFLSFFLISKCLIIKGNETRTIFNSFTYIQSIIVIELKNHVIVLMCLKKKATSIGSSLSWDSTLRYKYEQSSHLSFSLSHCFPPKTRSDSICFTWIEELDRQIACHLKIDHHWWW